MLLIFLLGIGIKAFAFTFDSEGEYLTGLEKSEDLLSRLRMFEIVLLRPSLSI